MIYVYLLLIHVVVQQKPTRYCKAIILQLKIKKNFFLTKQEILLGKGTQVESSR